MEQMDVEEGTECAAKRKAATDVELCSAYDFVRSHYTDSESAVQGWRNSKSNLSQGPLNKRMLQMLELQPGMTIADLGSGCGITAIAFSVFGCASVLGFEVHEYSCEVAREMAETIRLAAAAEGRGQVTVPTFINAAVNERLRGGGEMMFDRLHGGYMMSQENASRYAREHLNPNGIAVMNVGSGNNGAVTIFRKDAAGIVSSEDSGIKVVFQEDLRPAAEVELLQRVVSAGTEARLQTVERDLVDLERDVQRYVLISGACAQAHSLARFLLSPHPRSHVLQAAR